MSSILVIEDEGFIAGILKNIVGREGYRTVMARTVEDAVRFALREVPCLIVVDLEAADIDGYGIIQLLRDHPKIMHIPIVVISARQSSHDMVEAYNMGVDTYLSHPLESDVLLSVVRRHLHRIQQDALSPLSHLPGGMQVERAIHYKLKNQEPWSILYLDLDNFKGFNDVYGFRAGNEMILLVGRICQSVVYEYGNADDFIGHVGGDDFVIVTTPDRSSILYKHILTQFHERSIRHYRPGDLEHGAINGVDRKGRPYQFPLVSLSIGVVSDRLRSPHTLDEVSSLTAEAKWQAKHSSASVFLISSQRDELCKNYSSTPSPSLPSTFQGNSQFGRSLFPYTGEDVFAEHFHRK